MKARLNRHLIADAGLLVADRDGMNGVTMRSIAAELKAAPMALYRHVRNKAELLDVMFERLLERVFITDDDPGDLPWTDIVMSAARRARQLLGDHPNWLPLLTRSIAPRSAVLVFERIAIAMARDRVALPHKLDAVTSLMCFTLGFVLVERMMKRDDGKVVPLEQLRLARFAAAPLMGISFDGWSFDAAFESGLATLVSELHRHRAAS
jgi:AcrR family transcriptional regulator